MSNAATQTKGKSKGKAPKTRRRKRSRKAATATVGNGSTAAGKAGAEQMILTDGTVQVYQAPIPKEAAGIRFRPQNASSEQFPLSARHFSVAEFCRMGKRDLVKLLHHMPDVDAQRLHDTLAGLVKAGTYTNRADYTKFVDAYKAAVYRDAPPAEDAVQQRLDAGRAKLTQLQQQRMAQAAKKGADGVLNVPLNEAPLAVLMDLAKHIGADVTDRNVIMHVLHAYMTLVSMMGA